ncbi:MAG: bifunctional folylpolyglutamate synthase/dihydrofolate synthase, partial [Acidimicrobiales bacterium]
SIRRQTSPPPGQTPSRFEILTAAALSWFADEAVDVAVVEVGLGGRHDATNVVDAQVAVVTNVALDHSEVIGPTLGDIAREKAGIVKPGSTLVLGEADPVLAGVFRDAGAAAILEVGRDFACESTRIAVGGRVLDLRSPTQRYPEVFLPLHGAHQGDNAAVALTAAEAFFAAPLDPEVVAEGFGITAVPGRLEVVGRRPLRILDGAHNPAGARAAGLALGQEFATVKRWVVVMGLLAGRDPAEMIFELGPARIAHLIACAPPSPRALAPGAVAGAATRLGIASETATSAGEALRRAESLAEPEDLILVTGSLYLVGEARSILLASKA